MELRWILGKLLFAVVAACSIFWIPIILSMIVWDEGKSIAEGLPETEIGQEIGRFVTLFRLSAIRRDVRRGSTELQERTVSRMVGKKAEAEAYRLLRQQRPLTRRDAIQVDGQLGDLIRQALDELGGSS